MSALSILQAVLCEQPIIAANFIVLPYDLLGMYSKTDFAKRNESATLKRFDARRRLLATSIIGL